MADRFWVAGTWNWDASTTTHWSTTSGGSGGASVPTSADNVIFDILSNATAYTVTITATANCLDFTMAWPVVGKVTLAGGSVLNVYWNFSLSGGTAGINDIDASNIRFTANSGTKTINSNWVKLLTGFWLFWGGTFQLLADISTWSAIRAGSITRSSWTFDWNGFTVILLWTVPIIAWSWTFANLTRTGTASKTNTMMLSANQTVTGTLTINWNSAINRILIKSDTLWTARTITAGTVSCSNVDFQDITGAGAGNWNLSAITGLSGDCGGNSGITFTTPVTTTRSAGTTWSTATWSSRVPLPQDSAIFSWVSSVTLDMPRIWSVDFSWASSWTVTIATSVDCYWNFILTWVTGMVYSWSATIWLLGRGSYTFNLSTFAVDSALKVDCVSWVYTCIWNVTFAWAPSLVSGGLIFTSNLITTRSFSCSGTATRSLTLGSSIWNMYYQDNWYASVTTNLTFNAWTSTIKFTSAGTLPKAFIGGWLTYYNFWNNTGSKGTLTISWNNTFNDFKIDAWRSNTLFATWSTQTFSSFTAVWTSGSPITINSTTTGTHTLTAPTRNNANPISCDYLNIQHSIATPSNTWYAGANSVNNQAVATAGSGWVFSVPVLVALSNYYLSFFNS